MKLKKFFIITKHAAGKNCNGNMELFELGMIINLQNLKKN